MGQRDEPGAVPSGRYIRDRAIHYRKLADAEPNGTAKQLSYREIADLLDQEADAILSELSKRLGRQV